MLETGRPLILVLDPDEDFHLTVEGFSLKLGCRVKGVSHTRQSPADFQELLHEHFPDVVLLNLDQDPEASFGDSVLRLLQIPVPRAPIVIGVTQKADMAYKALAYEAGLDECLLRPFQSQELFWRLKASLRIRKLQRELDLATSKLSELNSSLRHSNRSLEELTLTDELTGMNNMRFVTQYLNKQFELFFRYNRPLSIMMIDLDHFKQVNDKNDHLTGSAAIKRIGRVIMDATRGSDIKARYGGDEYIVAMPETGEESAKIVGERIRANVESCALTNSEGQDVRVTSSIGIATFDKKRHGSFKDLIRDADYALYAAKHGGRNRVILFKEGETNRGDTAGYDSIKSSVMTAISKAE